MKIITRQFDIPADLHPYLDSIWYCAGEGPASEISPVHSCLPTGMSELIIHLTPQRHHVKWRGEWMEFPEAFVVGVQTEFVNWKMTGGTVMLGITIKPEMFGALFNRPVGEVAGNYAEVNDFFGSSLNGFIESLKDDPDAASALQKTTAFFRGQVNKVKKEQERSYLPEALQFIRYSTGAQSVDDVCGKVFVGKRQLQRAFQDFIGVSPKTYGRLVRFKSVYNFVQQYPQATWTDITYHFGYADQSHFIRDFKHFAGENPTTFLSGFLPKMNMPFALSI